MQKKLSLLLVTSILGASSVMAKTGSVGAILSTAGVGVEGKAQVAEQLAVRASIRGFEYKTTAGEGAFDLTPKLKLLSAPITLDYYPMPDSGFFVSGGLAYNGNEVSATGKANKNVTLYGHTYTPAEIGSVKTKIKLGNTISPIASIGYDSSYRESSNIAFSFELGAMYSGKPKLTVTSTGLLNEYKNEIGLDDIKREAQKALDDQKKLLRWYPVVSFGVKYAF